MKANWIATVNWEQVKTGLQKYIPLMEFYRHSNPEIKWDDEQYGEFRRKYNHFYRMRRGVAFQQEYYGLLFINKDADLTFEKVLKNLQAKTGRVEASFASKLLATKNPDMPIWDSEVLNKLKLKAPSLKEDSRIEKVIDCYQHIVDWYQKELVSENGKAMLEAFEEKIGNTSITDTKKIDFMLWQKDR